MRLHDIMAFFLEASLHVMDGRPISDLEIMKRYMKVSDEFLSRHPDYMPKFIFLSSHAEVLSVLL